MRLPCRKYIGVVVLLLSGLASCQERPANVLAKEVATHLTADTCDNPDAPILCCFEYIPQSLTASMNISKEDEPGEKLHITGTLFKAVGKTPYPDVILYAYQTDAEGYYAKSGKEKGFQKWHGKLHGWCKTDEKGRYEIQTIRPARYPDNSMPAHIHLAIRKPDTNQSYYISDIVFKDDSLVNERYLQAIKSLPGGTGIVDVKKLSDGSWVGKRNITLSQ